MQRSFQKHHKVARGSEYSITNTSISLRHMPKNERPHGRTSSRIAQMVPNEKPAVQTPKIYQFTRAKAPQTGFVSGIYDRLPYPVKVAITGIAAVFTLIVFEPAMNVRNLLFGQGKGTIAMNKEPQGKLRDPNSKEAKILGNENFEKVELKDGVLTITNLKMKNGSGNVKVDIRGLKEDLSKQSGTAPDKIPETIPLGIYRNPVDETGIYLVYEQTILFLLQLPNADLGAVKQVWVNDNSQLFAHEGAVFLAKDGSIVATTPTTLLMITTKEVVNAPYKKLFDVDINLKNPHISKGKNDNYVDLRDETLKTESGKTVKIEIELSTTVITPRVDVASLGAR